MTVIVLLSVGALAGFAAGLFGIGGGLVIVPALVMILDHNSVIAESSLMHVAIGTSLATVTLTAVSSTWSHHRRKAVLWSSFRRLLPGLLSGGATGVILAEHLSEPLLRTIFGFFEIFMAVHIATGRDVTAVHRVLAPSVVALVGFIIGTVSTTLGVGGGPLTTPFLLWCNKTIHHAVATAAACGLPIAAIGALGFAFTGWQANMPPWSTGYIYWPAVVIINTSSFLCAPLGAKAAHAIVSRVLKKAFAVLLLLLGIKTLMGA